MIEEYICPSYYTPTFQIGMAFFTALMTGALSKGFISIIIWYIIFEIVFRWATRRRVHLYRPVARVTVITVGFIGILTARYLFNRSIW